MGSSAYLNKILRDNLKDFAVPIAILLMAVLAVTLCPPETTGVEIAMLNVPSTLQVTQ